MTALLWILLALFVPVLIAVSSPIRFGFAASFGKSRPQSADFRISYMHPLLFRYEYSSEDYRERTVFFGFTLKKKKKKDSGAGRDDARARLADERAGSIDGGDAGRFHSTDDAARPADDPEHGRDGAQPHSTDSRSAPADGYEPLWATALRRLRGMWENPLWKRLMNNINDFKGHSAYKFIRNRIFRKKIYRWLRQSLKSILSSMRFEMFRLRARAGFRDPAGVGKLYGYFTAARHALASQSRRVTITMEPVFTEECLEANIVLAGRTSIAQILSSFIVITLTFPYWKAYKIRKSK